MPASTSTPSLQGTFSVIGVGVPALTLDLCHTRAYSFTMTGASSTVTTTALTGALGLNTTAMTQPAFSGVKYSVSAGAAAVTFGSELTTANLDSNLMSGTKYFYFSPDGNFFFGGDPQDTDFIVGVRQGIQRFLRCANSVLHRRFLSGRFPGRHLRLCLAQQHLRRI